MIRTLHRAVGRKDSLLTGGARNPLVIYFVKKSVPRAPEAPVGDEFLQRRVAARTNRGQV